jgi:transcriptional regulator with XRE-family HTH domain
MSAAGRFVFQNPVKSGFVSFDMLPLCTYLVHFMQEFSANQKNVVYPVIMRTGRPTSQPRTAFGQRLVEARQNAGLSQAELAEQVDVDRRVIAHWERHSVTLRPEQIAALCTALDMTADQLLGISTAKPARGGLRGKASKVFAEVNELPRARQQHVLRVVEDLLTAQKVAN